MAEPLRGHADGRRIHDRQKFFEVLLQHVEVQMLVAILQSRQRQVFAQVIVKLRDGSVNACGLPFHIENSVRQ